MTDKDCLYLLRLLWEYVKEGSYEDCSISELAEDLAMSMDETSEEADQLRQEICFVLGA